MHRIDTRPPTLAYLALSILLSATTGGCEAEETGFQAARPGHGDGDGDGDGGASGSSGDADPSVPCEDDEFRAMSGTCVRTKDCSPGRYVLTGATEDSDRVCALCPNGTYSDQENSADCLPMRDCAPGQYAEARQLEDSDRICEPCPAGAFADLPNTKACRTWTVCDEEEWESTAPTTTSDRICSPASICEPGYYAAAEVNALEDRHCAPCPDGTFSDTHSASECVDWRTCGEDEWAAPGKPYWERHCIDFSLRAGGCAYPSVIRDSVETMWPAPDSPASEVTISSITMGPATFVSSGDRIAAKASTVNYQLSDGTTWTDQSNSSSDSLRITSTARDGDRVRYAIDGATEFARVWGADSEHAANFRVDILAPPTMVAEVGSKTATLEAELIVTEDFPTTGQQDGRFHFLSAPLCSIVKLSISYTITDGLVFDEDTFKLRGGSTDARKIHFAFTTTIDFANHRPD